MNQLAREVSKVLSRMDQYNTIESFEFENRFYTVVQKYNMVKCVVYDLNFNHIATYDMDGYTDFLSLIEETA